MKSLIADQLENQIDPYANKDFKWRSFVTNKMSLHLIITTLWDNGWSSGLQDF